MRERIFLIIFGLLATTAMLRADALEDGFKSPPDSARPHTWWHWMNGNVSRGGITKDLEAMKRVGLGGFTAFTVTDAIPPGPVKYMSDEWLDLMKHSASEARRVGLEMCMHNCAGWSSSGGPWMTPELSMQEIAWIEARVRGGTKVDVQFKQPETRKNFYRDIAVVAFPALAGDTSGKEAFRLHDWQWKSDRNSPGRKPDSQIVRDTRTAPAGDVIKLGEVIVLTDKMDASGKLIWDAPPGEWTVIRFGHTSTGRMNKPAPKEGEGLECDKLSRSAVKFQWDHSVQRVLDRLGAELSGRVLHDVLIDSYEVGFANWTDGLDKTFSQRLGYELTRYLPCLSGRVVENVDTSERFLWDFRRLIADLMAENYFGYFRELAHERGIFLSVEPYGPGGFDDFQVAAIADVPMGEFWIDRSDSWHFWSSKLASSAAHAGGKTFVGAESFTARPPGSRFTEHPAAIKTLGDHYFAQGINRIIFHTNVHQPWADDVLPGMTMGPHGMQFNRNNTWHAHARPWVDHLARTQFILQQGHFVADLCRLLSEDAPQAPLNRADMKPAPPAGYDYDMLHASFVMQMKVKDGRLVLPGGMSYRVLVLPDNDSLRPELLAKIVELKQAGATVFAPRKIVASPSLCGQPAADDKVAALAERITPGVSLTDLLPPRDFEPPADVRLDWLHCRVDGTDVYFVSNQEPREVSPKILFRAAGEAEIWRSDDGRIERAAEVVRGDDGRMMVTTPLGPTESVFVVFREHSSAPLPQQVAAAGEQALAGPWTLRFPGGWGAPEKIELPKLSSWTEHENPEVRHFSGTATYSMRLDVSGNRIGKGKTAMLDLGDVQVMAEVKLNGKELGLLWKPPFRVDVSDAIRAGENDLEVRLTNLWVNRLIGDEAYPPLVENIRTPRGDGAIAQIPSWLLNGQPRPDTQRKTLATWRHYKADDPLLPSGLLGPVRIRYGVLMSPASAR